MGQSGKTDKHFDSFDLKDHKAAEFAHSSRESNSHRQPEKQCFDNDGTPPNLDYVVRCQLPVARACCQLLEPVASCQLPVARSQSQEPVASARCQCQMPDA